MMRKMRKIPLFIGAVLLIAFAKPSWPGIGIGAILVLGGEAVRVWASGHLQKNEALTVTGPYAFVKNPLYVGSILITVGFCILAGNIYLLGAATLMFCFHYIPYKKRVEGDRLKKIFGAQYEDYDEKVPDYIPRRTPYSNQKGSWQFKCFIENSEEGILILILCGIVVVLSRPYWDSIF